MTETTERPGQTPDAQETPRSAPKPARPSQHRVDDLQKSFLPQSVVLEEAGTPRLVRAMILSVSALLIALVVWSAIAQIEEVTVGTGEILPAGRTLVVQHLEGGIISEILVGEGDHVDQGQALLRLDQATALAELDQTRARAAALELQARRLQAFADGQLDDPATLARPDQRFQNLVGDQRAILRLQELSRSSQRDVIETQVKQKHAELDRLAKEEVSLKRQLAIVREGFRMRQRLYEQGATSKVDYLDIKRDYERTKGDLESVSASKRQVTEELAEAQSRLSELDARLRSEALTQRGEVTAELAQVREKLVDLQDRVRRLNIRAASSGIVKGLTVNTIGGVIAPGQVLMEIVPADRDLIVEARISTRDVGHLAVGQPAKVKVDTYDFARYGAIEGTLRAISATTFVDDEGSPYYKGTVSLDQDFLGPPGREFQVSAGMTVQAEIITGSKSILQYLLKPIYVATNQAFRER